MEGNGICSAAFCESAALRRKLLLGARGLALSVTAYAVPPPPKGEVLLYLPADDEKLPQGDAFRHCRKVSRHH